MYNTFWNVFRNKFFEMYYGKKNPKSNWIRWGILIFLPISWGAERNSLNLS